MAGIVLTFVALLPLHYGMRTAAAQTRPVTVQPASWKAASNPADRQPFANAVTHTTVRASGNLAWGSSSKTVRRGKSVSGFTELTQVDNPDREWEPVGRRQPEVPNLFAIADRDAERRAEIENKRRVARIHSASAARPRNVLPVAAHEDTGTPTYVAERIPMNFDAHANPFEDADSPSVSSLNPHLDPFRDQLPAASISLSPRSEIVPTQKPAISLSLSPAFPSTKPTVTALTPAPLLSAPKPIPALTPKPVASTPKPAAVSAPKPNRKSFSHRIQQPVVGQASSPPVGDTLHADLSPEPGPMLSQASPDLDPLRSPFRPDIAAPPLRDETESVPEFPEYKDKREVPPTPNDVGRRQDGLPDIQEPTKPGAPSGEEPADEQPTDDLLDFLGDGDEGGKDDTDKEGKSDDAEDDDAEDDDAEKTRCQRVYNDINCCDQEKLCRDTMRKLRETRIEDVSVSITPPLVPLAEDETEIEEQRERLRESPIRNWMARDGTLIATGRLADFKDESIIVDLNDGGQVAIPYYRIGHDDLCFLTSWWRLPGECLLAGDNRAVRDFRLTTFTWKASAVCHKPLYFEEVQLERYGHSAGPILQPLLSGAHFMSNISLLPYNMGVYSPTECRYALGHYRPGSCAPWMIPAFPLSKRGAAFELGTVLGLWGLF